MKPFISTAATTLAKGCRHARRFPRHWRLPALFTLPLLITAMYLGVFAASRYVSDTSVAIKRSTEPDGAQFGLSLLTGVGNASSREDAMYLREYILSADMLNLLDEALDLRAAFEAPRADIIYRLPSGASRETFLEYYRARVNAAFDERSGLLNVRTEGFTPALALSLSRAILTNAESFINEVSHSVAREQTRYAQTEITEAQRRLRESEEKLLAYQNAHGMLDPVASAEATARLIAELEGKLAVLEAEQTNLLAFLNPTAPQAVAGTSAIRALKAQIVAEKHKVASLGGSKLNRQAAEFLALKSDYEFHTKLYQLAITSAEKTRVEAARKLKNLVVVASPQLAEDATHPRTWYVLASLALCLGLLYGATQLVVKIVHDHKD
ncbi:hypothetical protein [Pandoraea sp. NPDC087047]|uniref:hypothetical protein n=1 Tax=Pandoraea sp. NPDC087047 TaxID=3364390 RepID=UPI0037FA7572